MANTNIYIKRSSTHDRPGSLAAGEFGYSYSSNTLFLGTPDGTGVINVGGVFYTGMLDAATDAATGSVLVKRDATGNASFNYVLANVVGSIAGNADSATRLQTPRYFNITGDVDAVTQSFDGTANVDITMELTNTGVSAGTYGGATNIPVFAVDVDGRITSAANVSVATTLSYEGDTGTGALDILNDTLDFIGGTGITTTVDGANNAVIIDVDNTVIRTGGIASQTIDSDLSITGNVHIFGNTVYTNVETLNVADPLIYLAANNTSSDIVDIGFAGQYFDGTTQRRTGLTRIHGTNEMYAFTHYDKDLVNNILDVGDSSLVLANLHASLTGGMVYGLANTIGVLDGGTGQSSFNNGSILVGNGSGALQVLANTTFIQVGDLNTTNTVTSITVDEYGRLTDLTSQPISGLRVEQGGTGQSTFTQGSILVGDGTNGLKELANVTYSLTGSLAANNTITSLTVDAYGRVSAATGTAISGLTVGQGGTGKTTFTSNGLIFGNGAGDMQVTAAAGTADQTWSNQILTTTNAGVPVWSTTLDGGQF